MKVTNVFILLSLVSLAISASHCKQDDPLDSLMNDNDGFSFIGAWELTEKYSHPPTGTGWVKVEDGFNMEFKSNGIFVSNRFTKCLEGTFKVSENRINLIYSCEGFTAGFEEPEGTFSYDYTILDKATIELAPSNYSCYEGCMIRMSKSENATQNE